jgi:hypothetical protein
LSRAGVTAFARLASGPSIVAVDFTARLGVRQVKRKRRDGGLIFKHNRHYNPLAADLVPSNSELIQLFS